MIRILHLTEPRPDFETRRCVQQLSAGLGEGFDARVRTVGTGAEWSGIIAAARALRRVKGVDIVHAWSAKALATAVLAMHPHIIYSPQAVSASTVRWLRAIMAYRDLQVTVPTWATHRAMVGSGIDPQRCRVVPPGVDFSKLRRRRDRQLRSALGFTDEDCVLLAAGESTAAAAHEDAVWAAGILHVLEPRYRLLLWGQGDRVDAVRQFDLRIQKPGTLTVAEDILKREVEFEDLLAAADMIVNSSTGTMAPLPLMVAMASGLPIVSTVTYTAGELLEDHHNALLVPKRSPRKLAQRIMELREEPALQRRLAETARAEAYERFAMTKLLGQYRSLYREVSVWHGRLASA